MSDLITTSDANAKPGSGLIVHLSLGSGVGLDFSLGVNPTAGPLAAPLNKPPTAAAPESLQHPPGTLAPAISVATLSTQTSAAKPSVAMPPANNATISVASDFDSDDCDIVAVIRKEAGKQARLKSVPGHAIFRPDTGTVPPGFKSAIPMDIKTLSNIFGFRKSKERLKLGGSLKRPLVIDDSSDEEDMTTTNAQPKRVKKGDSSGKSSHRKEGKHSKSRHKSSEKSSKHHCTSRPEEIPPLTSPGMRGEANQRAETSPTSIPSIHGAADTAPEKPSKAAETAYLAAQVGQGTVDKAAKPKPTPHQGTKESSPSMVNPQSTTGSDERAWAAAQESAAAPAATRPTPISTIIAPTSHTRLALTRPAPMRPAAVRPAHPRPAHSATIAPVTPGAQDKTEEFKRKRREETKRKEEEILARKQAKEAEKQKDLPKNDTDLFQSFAAKVPQTTKTKIVNDVPANNFQRPEVRKPTAARKSTAQPSINIRAAPKTTAPRPAIQARHPIPPPPPRYPAHPDNDDGDDNEAQPAPTRRAVHPSKRNRQTAATNAYNQHPDNNLTYPVPRLHASSRPVETVDAISALGEDRTIIQYVVWRTTPFVPKGVETREHHKVRCSAHVDPQAANERAQAWYERPKKGIAGKSFKFVATNADAAKLFEGSVRFEGGKLQYMWVEAEEQSLVKVVKGGGGGLMLDREGARVVRRKRFDVVSVHFVWKEEEEGEGDGEEKGEERAGEEKGEEVQKKREMQSQVLVIDCGGEEEEDGANSEDTMMGDAEDQHGEGNKDKDGEEDARGVEDNTTIQTTIDSNTHTTSHRSLSYRSPQDAIDTLTKFHGAFTTKTDAQNAALKAFLALAKPHPSQPDEDKHWFEYYAAPEIEEAAKESIEKNPNGEFFIEWDPPQENKWNFFRLTVRVVESPLTGPIDISDMVVEAPEGVPAAAPAPPAPREKPAPRIEPVVPAPVALKPTTPPPPSPQRVMAAVAPATAPETSAKMPNTTLPLAATTSLVTTETRAPFVIMGDDESEVSEEE